MSKLLSLLLFFVIISAIVILPLKLLQTKAQNSPTTNEWTLVLGGDVMLGRSVTSYSLDTENDPNYPFLKIHSLLKDATIAFVNLETPVTQDCPRKNDGMIFCADPRMLNGLIYSGIDLVNLSNNHTLNYGTEGLSQTKQYLDLAKIDYSDDKKLLVKTFNNIKIGFLGFDKNQQSNPVLTTNEESLIKDSKAKVDILIIAMHWGIEYHAHPTDGQRLLAQELVNLGADLIVGHHPHWVQDVDHIGMVPIYYSLGNLIFDQPWSEETKKGLMIKLTLEGKKITKEEQIPIYMKNLAQPEITK